MGLREAAIHPTDASFDPGLGIFVLPYDAARRAADPDAMAGEFLQATYEAGADLGGWDRAMLEPSVPPERPPTRPWSTLTSRVL